MTWLPWSHEERFYSLEQRCTKIKICLLKHFKVWETLECPIVLRLYFKHQLSTTKYCMWHHARPFKARMIIISLNTDTQHAYIAQDEFWIGHFPLKFCNFAYMSVLKVLNEMYEEAHSQDKQPCNKRITFFFKNITLHASEITCWIHAEIATAEFDCFFLVGGIWYKPAI